jgi:hypothetical protein
MGRLLFAACARNRSHPARLMQHRRNMLHLRESGVGVPLVAHFKDHGGLVLVSILFTTIYYS